ncbi:O-antigen ligase [Flavivirga sp. 57AJ16]|uniref:O-antigen ligase family protein n=1 Tax=Flavivirga sp. 57AJ16 TaxID=3025307 RepID=UPI0023662CD5|nr:O-antigen ligase family protein [Flavivirga sp. 57AJ16]MDD7885921.1 O-antigen ligase family protein [Flavivirga sp. 57AJ16]
MLIPVIGFVYVKFIDEIDLKILYKALLYIIIPLSIWFVAFKYFLYNNAPFFDFRTDRTLFMPLRNSYLNFGYILGVLSILSIKYSKNPFLIILVCSILILALGSRGALLFLMISLFIVYFKELVLFFKNLKIKKRILRFILFSFVPFVCLLLIYYDKLKGAIEYGLIRFTSLLNASSDKSLLGRIDQYYYVIKEGFKPQGLTIGYGLGSFGLNYTHEEKLAYPHNIFLEAWYELGFFAMCLLIVLFVFPFFHLKREQVLKTLALFAFFNAMKTLSFSTDRNLFILFGILIFHKEICQKIYKSY